MKIIRTIRKLAKEEPLWLSVVIMAVAVIITTINVILTIAEIKGIL